jgi:hypothetical protein
LGLSRLCTALVARCCDSAWCRVVGTATAKGPRYWAVDTLRWWLAGAHTKVSIRSRGPDDDPRRGGEGRRHEAHAAAQKSKGREHGGNNLGRLGEWIQRIQSRRARPQVQVQVRGEREREGAKTRYSAQTGAHCRLIALAGGNLAAGGEGGLGRSANTTASDAIHPARCVCRYCAVRSVQVAALGYRG